MSEVDNQSEIARLRVELAAALRWAGQLGFQTGICNHFSLTLPGYDDQMLVNPEGYFWSEVTASSLVRTDFDGNVLEGTGEVEVTAFNIHAPIHRKLPDARVILHTHMPYTTAICMRPEGIVRPIYLSALSLYGGIVYDRNFDGGAFHISEGERLANLIDDKIVVMMQNHGPIVIGKTVGEALLRLIYLEDTCRIQILAEQDGSNLVDILPAVLDRVNIGSPVEKRYSEGFIKAVIRVLSQRSPDILS